MMSLTVKVLNMLGAFRSVYCDCNIFRCLVSQICRFLKTSSIFSLLSSKKYAQPNVYYGDAKRSQWLEHSLVVVNFLTWIARGYVMHYYYPKTN